jgi:hypothetical protein
MTEALRLQAARLALGLWVDGDQIKATVESLVDAGVWHEAFLPVLVERHPRPDDVMPAFRAALDHHGVAVPDKETAMRLLIAHYLRDVVATPSDARQQFGRFIHEVYLNGNHDMQDTKYVGDSLGIERLLALYWTADDLSQLQHLTFNGHHGSQAWFELNRLIVAEAERWLADRDEKRVS